MEEIHSRTTNDRFYLTVKVLKKKLSYRDHQSRGKEWNDTAETIILVPDQSTESDLFFNAWLPEKLTEKEKLATHGPKEYSEVVLEMGNPICGYFRGALCYGNKLIDRPHIFVMTKMAEEKLKSAVGKRIRATVIAEQEEEVLYGDLKAETHSPYSDIA